MTAVHSSAVVEPGAELGAGVVVGPFCRVGRGVIVSDGCELVSHVVVEGPTRLGRNNRLMPFSVLGAPPQDRSHGGEPTRLEIGDDNVFREQVTVHRGTEKGGGVTRIGSRCLFMVGAHVAHDCRVEDDVVLTNLTALGGHVVLESNVVSGGHVAVAPFVSVGRGAFLAGGARVEQDVPPFVIVQGDRARVRALNRVGLERMGVGEASQSALQRAFRAIWRSGEPIASGISAVRAELGEDPFVAELLLFLDKR
jgi:UDP-N-acetylglucosamine acyltransferase